MGGKFSKAGLFQSIAIFLFVQISQVSCGIDTISFLSEKPSVQSSTDSAINFKGPSIQDDNYYGLFLFYKIYAKEGDATSDLSLLEAKQNTENAVPGSYVETFLKSAGGLNYQQLVLDGELPIPSLPKENLDTNLLSINFASANNVEPRLTNTTLDMSMRRNALASNGTYLSFLEEPQAGNPDFMASTSDLDEGVYYIQFFAAAYGLDFSDFSDLYGDAVYLGRIKQYFLN